MYESFFGLTKKPFELVPNPDFLYKSRTHNKVGMYLDYAMRENTGFILLTGEVGSGKTTIIRSLLKKLGPEVQVSKVFNTKLSSEELLATINDDFGIAIEGKNKVHMLKDLNQFLIDQYGTGRRSVVIVDEAQNLSVDALEELRMLSNLETNDAKLLQIILVGQPELKRILSVPELRQLRQRISIHCHLQSLSREEMEAYIWHRLDIAGNRQAVEFSDAALALVFDYSGGIPRLINVMCDFLLLSAFTEEVRFISEELVAEVAGDPQFEGQFFPRSRRGGATSPPLMGRRAKGAKAPSPGKSSPPAASPAVSAPPPSPPMVVQDLSAPPQPASIPAAADTGSVTPERPLGPLAPGWQSEKGRPWQEEVEDLCRRLDCFEASVREVGQNILHRDSPPVRSADSDKDLILNMPKFDHLSEKKGGFISGFRKLFFRLFLS